METLECKVLDVKEWAGAPDQHGNKKYTVKYEGGEGVYTTKNNTLFKVGEVCKFTSEKATWSSGKEYFKLRRPEDPNKPQYGGGAPRVEKTITKEHVASKCCDYATTMFIENNPEVNKFEWKDFEATVKAMTEEVWKQVEVETTYERKDACVYTMYNAMRAYVSGKIKTKEDKPMRLSEIYRHMLGSVMSCLKA